MFGQISIIYAVFAIIKIKMIHSFNICLCIAYDADSFESIMFMMINKKEKKINYRTNRKTMINKNLSRSTKVDWSTNSLD